MAMERWRSHAVPMGRWEPFQGVTDIQHEVNRLFDSFFGRPSTVQTAVEDRMWIPLADMYETKDDVVIRFEVPGVSDKEIDVTITGDLLTVKGERKWDRDVREQTFHRVERTYGKFERTVSLPMLVQADKVQATYRDGVLEVKLPKAEEVKPKSIKVGIL